MDFMAVNRLSVSVSGFGWVSVSSVQRQWRVPGVSGPLRIFQGPRLMAICARRGWISGSRRAGGAGAPAHVWLRAIPDITAAAYHDHAIVYATPRGGGRGRHGHRDRKSQRWQQDHCTM